MLELLDIRFSFILRGTRVNAEGKSPIIFRIIYRRERRDIFTGLYCTKKQWSSTRTSVLKSNIDYVAINQNLNLINRKAFECFESLKYSGSEFTMDELVNKIKGKEEKPLLLIDYLEFEKEKLLKRKKTDISTATYDKYRRSASHVQEFILSEFQSKNYPLYKIDRSFLENYFQYLRSIKSISHNTSVKYLTFFKTIMMPALKDGLVKDDPFRQLKFRVKTIQKGFLTKEEIQKISALNLSADQNRIRDLFLFSCFTGLSYSDLKQLARYHIIKEGENNYYIIKPRQKTGEESIIPLLPVAISILQKYSMTTDPRDFIWKVSANQKMNQRLKAIGISAGIDKSLHMHLARHTFATTVTLANGIPIETVSKMLGHATLKQTQHYAKVIGTKIKADMEKINSVF